MTPSLSQKLATACRYSSSPSKYPWLWRRSIGRWLLGAPASLEDSGPQSVRWCRQHCLKNTSVLRQLVPDKAEVSLESRHPELLTQAHKAVEECPQVMGGGANLNLLYNLTLHLEATSVVETGVAYGWSSLAILLAQSELNRDTQLISTNLHYREFEDDDYVGCAVPSHLRSTWQIISQSDRAGLPQALAHFPDGIDLCHYDSDKSYEGRLLSYTQLWEALKPNGLLISDDIQDNLAFAHFSKMTDTKPIVTDASRSGNRRKFIGILRKRNRKPIRPITF